MDKFVKVEFSGNDSKNLCFRSGKAVYEETFLNGVLVGAGYNFTGYPLNVLTNFPTRLNSNNFTESSSFNLEIDGVSVDYDLSYEDFYVDETANGKHSTLIIKSNIKPVKIYVHTLIDGSCAFTRYLEIENLSDNTLNISRLGVFGGGLQSFWRDAYSMQQSVDDIYSIGYFKNDAPCCEGEFVWETLKPEVTVINTRFKRDRFRHPLLFVRNNFSGEMFNIQIGWSGGCCFSLDFNAQNSRNAAHLELCTEITGFNPLYVLSPKEKFTTPEVHIAMSNQGFDDIVNQMHSHLRTSVLNDPNADGSIALIGCGMGAEHDMSVETSKIFIDQMKEMGGELFIIDAGWYCPPNCETQWGNYNGVNVPNKDRYPRGISEIRDYCHSKDMKFGMWVEIERLGINCSLYNDKPEWFASNKQGDKSQGFIDFTNPEAAKWAEDELSRIIKEYELDLLRVDYNIDIRNTFNMRNVVGTKECLSVRHINAVYQMYRNLKKKFPNVIFENCASGGGRTDTGFMKAFNHTWVSDWQRMPRSVVITNGMTMALPPERVDRLFAGMGCHEFGSVEAHLRNTMFGHMSLNVISPAALEANSEVMEFIKHSTDVYKNHIRPFLSHCKVYHHTPEVGVDCDTSTVILEISDCDYSRGAIGVFTLGREVGETNIKFKGVSAQKNYHVTLDNTQATFELSGVELKMKGITLNIPSALASELVYYSEV